MFLHSPQPRRTFPLSASPVAPQVQLHIWTPNPFVFGTRYTPIATACCHHMDQDTSGIEPNQTPNIFFKFLDLKQCVIETCQYFCVQVEGYIFQEKIPEGEMT